MADQVLAHMALRIRATSRVQDNGRVGRAIDILNATGNTKSVYQNGLNHNIYSSVVLSNRSLNGPSCAVYQEYPVVVCHIASSNQATVLLAM